MGQDYQTAFDMLGVPLDADDEQIRNAYAAIRGAHGLDDNRVPAKLRDAFALLGSERGRASYREVVSACRDGRCIRIAAPEQQQFRDTCAAWAIRVWDDLFHPGVFFVWEANQPEPPEATRQRQAAAAPPGSLRSVSVQKLFRRFLAFTVVVIISVAAVVAYRAWSEAAAERAQRELIDAIRTALSTAEKHVTALEHGPDALAQEFRDLAGFELAAAQPKMQRPRELDLALIRHESVRNAWDELLTQRLNPATLADLRSECERLRQELDSGIVDNGKRDDAHRLVADLDQLDRRAKADRANIRHIRGMLEADRLERALYEPEGRSP